MSIAEIIACALSLCLVGMLLLSQAMDRHCDQVVRRGEPGRATRWSLRALATLFLGLSLWLCIQGWGGSVGTVAWLGWLSVAALMVAWLLTYAPQSGAAVVALTGLLALAWTALRGFAA